MPGSSLNRLSFQTYPQGHCPRGGGRTRTVKFCVVRKPGAFPALGPIHRLRATRPSRYPAAAAPVTKAAG